MLRFFYKTLKAIVPTRVKALIVGKVSAISRQAFSEEWAKATLIPLDQKLTRIEARLNNLEDYWEKNNIISQWVETSLLPLEQKIERVNAQMASKEMLLEAKSYLEQKMSSKDMLFEVKSYLEQQMASKDMLFDLKSHLESEVASQSYGGALSNFERSLLNLENKLENLATGNPGVSLMMNPLASGAAKSGEILSDEEYFNFEKQFHLDFEDSEQSYKDQILSYIKLTDKVVEIGCGAGRTLKYIKNNYPESTVLGIDNNKYMVAKAVEDGVDAVCGDALEIMSRQGDDTADVVLAIHLIEHLALDYVRQLINNIYRVLKSGGRLIIETPNTQSLYVMSQYYYADPSHQPPRHPSLFAYVLRSIGFSDVTIEFSGQPSDDLIMHRSKSKGEELSEVVQDNAIRFNQLFFSAGNNVIIEAVK